jgi:HD-GYP domain-containing protein (c-di-GMP phosphodiesterase class II)
MNAIPIKNLAVDTVFDKPVYLDLKYILLAPEVPVTKALLRDLITWEFREVHSDGTQRSIAQEEPLPEDSGAAESGAAAKEAKDEDLFATAGQDKVILRTVTEFYNKFTAYVDQVFTKYVTRNDLNIQEISNRVKELCDFIHENRRFVLRVQDMGASNRNYLVSHSVKSCILSIVLGSYLKFQPHKLIELGVAALLHEIGMVRLPPQLYMTERQLTPQEKKNIFTHPVHGYNILREFSFPLAICLASLEHHERNNGQGYPRNLSGEKISPYSKIIAVACSYDALTSSRPYKAAKDSYSGMVDMLKNEGKQYEEAIIRALVYSLSIYPIGSFVLLSDGRTAQVVETNLADPRFPIVSVAGEAVGEGQGSFMRTGAEGVTVKRILSKDEAAAFLGK